MPWADPNWPITPGPPPPPNSLGPPPVPGLLVHAWQLRTAWVVNVARRNLKANRGFSGQLSLLCEQFFDLVQTEICPAAAQPFLHSQPRRNFFADSLYHQPGLLPSSVAFNCLGCTHRPVSLGFPSQVNGLSTMGIIEDEVKGLHAKLEGLESRIKSLESRQFGGPLTAEQIRMILIGPPGAG